MATWRGPSASSLRCPEGERDAGEEAKMKAGGQDMGATSKRAMSISAPRGRRFRSTWPIPRKKPGRERHGGWSCAKSTAPRLKRAEPLKPRKRCKGKAAHYFVASQ